MSFASKHRQIRGFTLIELLITISIAAIILSLAAAGFGELIAKNRMSTAVNGLIANLQLARSEAVTRGRNVTLCPENAATAALDCAAAADPNIWHPGYIVYADSNNDGNVDADEVIRHAQGSASATIVISSAGRSRVTFNAEGASAGSTATFTFCDTNETATPRELVLSNVGRARSDDSDACGY